MPVNFSQEVYLPAQDLYSRTVTITPVASQPSNVVAYVARGILDTEAIDVQGLEGTIISETRVILDIRDAEFSVLPMQGDVIDIPSDSGLPAEGQFEVIDSDPNGGGETTLTLRHIVQAKP
jgi:RNase P/RNase MRP subunit p29